METVAKQIIDRLVDLGVTRAFSIPGGASSGLEVALFDDGRIEHIVCQHESTAGYMAMGHHLATGEVGVLIVTSGPGALNAAPALAAAKADEIGLLVIAGDVARKNANRGALQDGGWSGLDLMNAMRPLAGLAVRIDHPAQAPARLEQVLHRCQQHPRGPAFLKIPIDVQTAEASGSGFALPIVAPPPAEDVAIGAIVDLWSTANSPAIMFGIGAKRMALDDEVRAFVDHVGVPAVADAEGLGLIPRDHELFVGVYGVGDTGAGRRFLSGREIDLLLVLGCRLDDTTTAGFSEDVGSTRIVQLDYDPRRLGRSFAAAQAVHCDLGDALTRLTSLLPKAEAADVDQARARVRRVKRIPHRPMPELGEVPHDPRAVVEALDRHFKGATFVSDIGNHLLATLGYLNVEASARFHFSLGLGGMGSGIGMSLGMSRSKRTVCICGDGGTLMSGNELFTAVKNNWPITYCVFVDGELGMVVDGIQRVYGRTPAYSLTGFDVLRWAESLGCRAVHVEGKAQLASAAQYVGGPQVLVVAVDPAIGFTNPREAIIHFEDE